MEQQIQQLNALRGRARRAVLYLGMLLLGVLVFGFSLGMRYAALMGVLTLVLYVLWLRPEKKRYASAAQEAILLASAGRLQDPVYGEKSALSLEDVQAKGLLPMESRGAILRYALSGRGETGRIRLTDVSFVCTFQGEQTGTRAATFSGCWAELSTERDCGFTAVFCVPQLLPQQVLAAWYTGQGLRLAETGNPSVLCFEHPARPVPPDAMKAICDRLEPLGDFAARFDGQSACMLTLHRFLNCGEPDYKQTWTQERIRKAALRWLDAVLAALEFPAANMNSDILESEEEHNGNA